VSERMTPKRKVKCKRYAVINPRTRRYAAGTNGSVKWTEDRKEAERVAAAFGGVVVDAEEFCDNPQAVMDRAANLLPEPPK
jgi:hypothetical protein